jgi:hypothetical protein
MATGSATIARLRVQPRATLDTITRPPRHERYRLDEYTRAAPKGFGAISGKTAGGLGDCFVVRSGVDMARRDFFVAASMLGGSLLVVQTLASLFEAMAHYA